MDKLENLLDGVLQRMGVRGQVREIQLQAAFSDIVGPALAPGCRVLGLDHAVLVVGTSNTALAHQLRMDSVQLIARINAALGHGDPAIPLVRRIRFSPIPQDAGGGSM